MTLGGKVGGRGCIVTQADLNCESISRTVLRSSWLLVKSVTAAAGADDWLLGSIRDRGSIHSDIWRGSAAALAERDAIGVFPISGWWKEKPSLQRWDRATRYALLVLIRAPGSDVDIYNGIFNQLAVPVPAASGPVDLQSPAASRSRPHRAVVAREPQAIVVHAEYAP